MTSIPDRAGLQPERTALAWQRTALTSTFALIPLIMINAKLGQWWLVSLASGSTITTAVLLTGLHHRLQQLLDDSRPPAPFTPMLGVAAVTGMSSILGAATGVLSWWR